MRLFPCASDASLGGLLRHPQLPREKISVTTSSITLPRLAFVAAYLFLTACSAGRASPAATPSSVASSEMRAIRAARVEQNRAIAEGDEARITEHWTEDVTARRGLGAPVAGRQAYFEIVQPAGATRSRLVYERIPVEIEVSERWPLAFETGTWAGHLDLPQAPDLITGRYSAQWVKREGRWLIRSEVFVALSCRESGCDSQALP